MGIKLPTTSRSNNFKQLVLTGPSAIIETLLLMFNTPINRSQEDPNFGFDLDDFLFRVKNSEELSDLKQEFSNKVKSITLDQNVTTNFAITDGGKSIEISVGIKSGEQVINVPFKIENGRAQVVDKITLE